MYALYPDNTCKVYTTKGTSIDEIITSGEDAWYISKSYIRKITDNLETMEWKCAIDFISYSDIYDITLVKKAACGSVKPVTDCVNWKTTK